jgi:hypothetical protein
MSIATLKKKTAAKYNNNSVGETVFSLNGTHRNQGYVGQTSLSRFTSRSLVRNGGLRNHGGCCGTFDIGRPVLSGINTTEDSSVVKDSVLTNDGMIQTKYRWINRPQPYAVVKNDNNHNVNDQSNYITNLSNRVVSSVNSTYKVQNCSDGTQNTTECKSKIFYTKPASSYTGPGTVPQFKGVALSQSKYNALFKLNCSAQDEPAIIKNISGKPFGSSK